MDDYYKGVKIVFDKVGQGKKRGAAMLREFRIQAVRSKKKAIRKAKRETCL